MSKELTIISPEGYEIAIKYIELGSPEEVALHLNLPVPKVVDALNTREVKKYIDTIYLDRGYRNRTKIASVLDEIIEAKLEEARETEQYTKKDILDILKFAWQMRQDEVKNEQNSQNIRNQTNVQINHGEAGSNYNSLMQKLINPTKNE